MTKLVEPANPPTNPVPYGIGERAVSSPTVFGGVVFFPPFIPTNDICVSSGTSRLWALFYKTGSAYQEPIIGTTTSGANQTVNKFGSLGEGLAFGIVVHMGSGRDGGSPFGLLINMKMCIRDSPTANPVTMNRFLVTVTVSWQTRQTDVSTARTKTAIFTTVVAPE